MFYLHLNKCQTSNPSSAVGCWHLNASSLTEMTSGTVTSPICALVFSYVKGTWLWVCFFSQIKWVNTCKVLKTVKTEWEEGRERNTGVKKKRWSVASRTHPELHLPPSRNRTCKLLASRAILNWASGQGSPFDLQNNLTNGHWRLARSNALSKFHHNQVSEDPFLTLVLHCLSPPLTQENWREKKNET